MQDLRPSTVLPLIAWIATLIFAGPGLYQAADFNFATPTMNEWIGLLVWGMGPLAIGTMVWFHGLRQVCIPRKVAAQSTRWWPPSTRHGDHPIHVMMATHSTGR
jgi:hypothetical protein